MKKRLFALSALLALCALLASCAAPPKADVSPAPSISPVPALGAGRWELVCDDYRPVGYDLCAAAPIPYFEGKSKEQWADYSISIGRSDQSFMTWAAGGTPSPDGRYLAYVSDKDCLEQDSYNSMSVFLLDLYSQKETVLLSGKGNVMNAPLHWLDDETLLCTTVSLPAGITWDAKVEWVLCGVDGSTRPLELEEREWSTSYAARGRVLAYFTGEMGPGNKELRMVRIEEDGSVTELGRKEFDGYPINGGGVSADGRFLVFPLRSSWESVERQVCVWDTATGETALIEDPTPAVGTDIAASWVNWESEYPQVDFNIQNAPDNNGHNELWRYVFDG